MQYEKIGFLHWPCHVWRIYPHIPYKDTIHALNIPVPRIPWVCHPFWHDFLTTEELLRKGQWKMTMKNKKSRDTVEPGAIYK